LRAVILSSFRPFVFPGLPFAAIPANDHFPAKPDASPKTDLATGFRIFGNVDGLADKSAAVDLSPQKSPPKRASCRSLRVA
jgi:hypothetical protein